VENSLIENVLKVCQTLNAHSVEYLIIGGTAVALHGYYRLSLDPSGKSMEKPDLDFWYNPTYDNYYRLLDTLEELGLDVIEFRDEISPNPEKSFFRFEQESFKLDFLPEILGLSKFRTSYTNGIVLMIRDVGVRYLNYDDLILSKKALSRKQDIEDIDQLQLRKDNPGT
jgi:predicted nucleotidyltransferase